MRRLKATLMKLNNRLAREAVNQLVLEKSDRSGNRRRSPRFARIWGVVEPSPSRDPVELLEKIGHDVHFSRIRRFYTDSVRCGIVGWRDLGFDVSSANCGRCRGGAKATSNTARLESCRRKSKNRL